MNVLRQNTATEIIISSKQPLTDCVDGKTPIEELTLGDIIAAIYKGITRTPITLTVSGGDNNFTHVADGYWKLSLAAGNLDTICRLKITLRDDDVFLAVSEEFIVLPANVYDSLMATDKVLAQQETSDFIKNVLEADAEVNTATNPWQLVIKHKTSQAVLIRKDLKDVNGIGITSTTKIIGQHKETT